MECLQTCQEKVASANYHLPYHLPVHGAQGSQLVVPWCHKSNKCINTMAPPYQQTSHCKIPVPGEYISQRAELRKLRHRHPYIFS